VYQGDLTILESRSVDRQGRAQEQNGVEELHDGSIIETWEQASIS
jgi:hypothetical protein